MPPFEFGSGIPDQLVTALLSNALSSKDTGTKLGGALSTVLLGGRLKGMRERTTKKSALDSITKLMTLPRPIQRQILRSPAGIKWMQQLSGDPNFQLAQTPAGKLDIGPGLEEAAKLKSRGARGGTIEAEGTPIALDILKKRSGVQARAKAVATTAAARIKIPPAELMAKAIDGTLDIGSPQFQELTPERKDALLKAYATGAQRRTTNRRLEAESAARRDAFFERVGEGARRQLRASAKIVADVANRLSKGTINKNEAQIILDRINASNRTLSRSPGIDPYLAPGLFVELKVEDPNFFGKINTISRFFGFPEVARPRITETPGDIPPGGPGDVTKPPPSLATDEDMLIAGKEALSRDPTLRGEELRKATIEILLEKRLVPRTGN